MIYNDLTIPLLVNCIGYEQHHRATIHFGNYER